MLLQSGVDQFIPSGALVYGAQDLKFAPASFAIFNQPTAAGLSGRPLTFYCETLKGCSDHFPINAKIDVM